MGNPREWVNRAQATGIYEAPEFGEGPAVAMDPNDRVWHDSAQSRAAQLRDAAVQRQIEEEEDEAAERQERRMLRRMERRAAMEKLSGGGNSQAEMMKMMDSMFKALSEDKRELMLEIRDARNNPANDIMLEKLNSLSSRLDNIQTGANAPAVDPLEHLVNTAKSIAAAQDAFASALPKQAPPPGDSKPSRREVMDQIRIDEEAEIRKMEAQGRIDAIKANREIAQAELAVKERRIDKAMGMVENVLGPIAGKLGGDGVGKLMGNGATPGLGTGGDTDPNSLPMVNCVACSQPMRVNPALGTVVQCPRPDCNAQFNIEPTSAPE